MVTFLSDFFLLFCLSFFLSYRTECLFIPIFGCLSSVTQKMSLCVFFFSTIPRFHPKSPSQCTNSRPCCSVTRSIWFGENLRLWLILRDVCHEGNRMNFDFWQLFVYICEWFTLPSFLMMLSTLPFILCLCSRIVPSLQNLTSVSKIPSFFLFEKNNCKTSVRVGQVFMRQYVCSSDREWGWLKSSSRSNCHSRITQIKCSQATHLDYMCTCAVSKPLTGSIALAGGCAKSITQADPWC